MPPVRFFGYSLIFTDLNCYSCLTTVTLVVVSLESDISVWRSSATRYNYAASVGVVNSKSVSSSSSKPHIFLISFIFSWSVVISLKANERWQIGAQNASKCIKIMMLDIIIHFKKSTSFIPSFLCYIMILNCSKQP